MPRLMDMGLERLSNAIADMGGLAQESVLKAIQAYVNGEQITQEALERSNQLSMVATEVEELAVDLLARYQPVATDLRLIKSCLEIAYGFSRFGRYAYDIAQVLEIYGDLSQCDKSDVQELSEKVTQMIKTSILCFKTKDTKIARSLRQEDDQVDKIYRGYLKRVSQDKTSQVKCALASTLVLRYLERIGDHACYIGDSVTYIVTGSKV
ncbi:MAG: phosphate uptake regulator PhoU [Candidatus Bathyarchaeia archaeon]